MQKGHACRPASPAQRGEQAGFAPLILLIAIVLFAIIGFGFYLLKNQAGKMEPKIAKVTGAMVSVLPANSSTCPTTFNFTGVITSESAGKVEYIWERSDGALAPKESIEFSGSSSMQIATYWQLSGTYAGWERIRILSSNDFISNEAEFKLNCSEQKEGESESVPNANWRIFANNVYSFKYPKEWFLVDNDTDQILYKSEEAAKLGYQDFVLTVSSSGKSLSKTSFSDAVGTRKEIGDKIFSEKIADLIVDGRKAVRYKAEVLPGSQTDAVPREWILIDNNDKLVNLNIKIFKDPVYKSEEILDQVYNSFKFLQ